MILGRIAPLLISVALVAGCADAPTRDGRYSNVVFSEETGDQGGAIVEFTGGSEPRVGFYLCEGACGDLQNAPANVDGGVVTFTAIDQGASGHVRFRGVFEKGGVTLTSPDLPELNAFLPKVDELRR